MRQTQQFRVHAKVMPDIKHVQSISVGENFWVTTIFFFYPKVERKHFHSSRRKLLGDDIWDTMQRMINTWVTRRERRVKALVADSNWCHVHPTHSSTIIWLPFIGRDFFDISEASNWTKFPAFVNLSHLNVKFPMSQFIPLFVALSITSLREEKSSFQTTLGIAFFQRCNSGFSSWHI